jgi:hypothetical protein
MPAAPSSPTTAAGAAAVANVDPANQSQRPLDDCDGLSHRRETTVAEEFVRWWIGNCDGAPRDLDVAESVKGVITIVAR